MTWIRALDWKKPIATDFFMEKNSVAGKEKCLGDKRANISNVCEPFSAATKRPHRRAISTWF